MRALTASHRELLRQIATFAVVGGTSTLAYGGTVWFCAHAAGLAPQVANLAGVACSAVMSYLGHLLFTFRAKGRHSRFIPRFLLQVAGALAASSAIVALGSSFGWPTLLVILVVCVVMPVASFLVLRLWVFMSPHPRDGRQAWPAAPGGRQSPSGSK